MLLTQSKGPYNCRLNLFTIKCSSFSFAKYYTERFKLHSFYIFDLIPIDWPGTKPMIVEFSKQIYYWQQLKLDFLFLFGSHYLNHVKRHDIVSSWKSIWVFLIKLLCIKFKNTIRAIIYIFKCFLFSEKVNEKANLRHQSVKFMVLTFALQHSADFGKVS